MGAARGILSFGYSVVIACSDCKMSSHRASPSLLRCGGKAGHCIS